ncbi:hypothetical protein H0H81_012064 [Sphagnurus paluster]|uniref:Transmembrane protein n=1 Tax=Sphagnurus paluster TaxID=117069 RepID=A0A9P7FTS1_9AGAR|nr:hypothetical protein H0H81_012064 [Sphagnurus paluster]
MLATRGLALFVGVFASFRETQAVAESTRFDLTSHTKPVYKRHSSPWPSLDNTAHLRRSALQPRQNQPDFGSLSTAFRIATWIWTADGAPPDFKAAPGADRAFRKSYTPPEGKTAVLAEVLISCDNGYVLFVNGGLVGRSSAEDSNSWKNAQGYRMALGPGPVVFAVRGTNAASSTGDNPAALILAIRITHADGSQALIITDGTWRSNLTPPPSFELPSTDDSRWSPATTLVRYGSGPWGQLVNLPSNLATVTLPPADTSATPSSTNTGSSAPPSSAVPSSRPASSSTVTVTQTGVKGESTAGSTASSNNTSGASSSNQGALIGGIIGGMVGFLLLVTLILFLWRRRRDRKEMSAAEIDSWTPAPHSSEPQPPMVSTITTTTMARAVGGGYGVSGAASTYAPSQYGTEAPSQYGRQSQFDAQSRYTADTQSQYGQSQYGDSSYGHQSYYQAPSSHMEHYPPYQAHNSAGSIAPLVPNRSEPGTGTPAPAYYSPPPGVSRPPYDQKYHP